MPVISTNPVSVVDPDQQYERLAFRCSTNAVVKNGTVESGTLSLSATKYRKVANTIDVLGMQGLGENGTSLTFGNNELDDTLINAVATIASGYAGVEGEVSLNFSWRAAAGDIVGMIMLTIKPEEGEEYSKGVGNSNELEASDPAFAQAFADIIVALITWTTVKGW